DAGEYTVNVTGTAKVTDAEGNDVTAQFAVTNKPGKLTISKRSVILTSGSDTKQYDGKPLTKHEVEVTGDGFVNGQGADYSYTGSQKLVGKSDNYFTYELKEGTDANNYSIETAYGALEVTIRDKKYEIKVEANSGTYKYDGEEKTVKGFKTLDFVVEDNEYTVSGIEAFASRKNVGTTAVKIKGAPVVKDADGENVTDQFSVILVEGTLTIEPRTVDITSGSATKPYDGKPLTKHESTTGGDGFAPNEGVDIEYTGTQTKVGTSDNTFKYSFKEGTLEGNYIIKPAYGTLTVTAAGGGNGNGDGDKDGDKNAKTGDSTPLMALLMLMSMAAIGGVSTLLGGGRRKNSKQ
ncbi:MAG: hypothetical protein Q4A40_00015, partial [Bacillota bacterium]|nr:hypothetical protein [Bacillota bacterium]